jgi:hypothetical protein|tara:strand:- start:1138 stop:1425 length:288 start_codon:yes stop_codon:yes gene_type:complete
MFDSGTVQSGIVSVETTSNRGFNPQEIAVRCANKIVSVSEDAHPTLRDQATAFKDQIEKVVEFYLTQAVQSDRTTVCNALNDAGHQELSELIRRL